MLLRPLAKDRFLLRLSSDLGGVWLFRIHCPEAAVLPLSRLGCVTFFVYVLGLSSSPLGVPTVPLRPLAKARFLLRLSSDLGGVWLFRIIVQRLPFCLCPGYRLRHVFCLRTGALFFSFRGSNGATTAPCEGLFFASPELGFRWCLAVSHPFCPG